MPPHASRAPPNTDGAVVDSNTADSTSYPSVVRSNGIDARGQLEVRDAVAVTHTQVDVVLDADPFPKAHAPPVEVKV